MVGPQTIRLEHRPLLTPFPLDQPVQTGFSYDSLLNITYDIFSGDIEPIDESSPKQNTTFLHGTYPSNDPIDTVNSTAGAARALWHFAQVFFQEFPDYKPNDDRISIWTESYGGKYGPAFAAFFESQNQKIDNGTFKEAGDTYHIHLDTLGIINGCIDILTQEESYIQIAYNNTYGIQVIDKDTYDAGIKAFNQPGGCKVRTKSTQPL